MLFEDLIWKLVVNVYLVFLVMNVEVITIRQVFALDSFQEIFAVLYRAIN